MSDGTLISWANATWNPVSGCTEVSPGCAHCYAKTFAERWRGLEGHYYENGFDVQLRPDMLERPLHWKKPRRIFVNSMSDLFHEDVPDGYIMRVLMIMRSCPQHTFQVLTKRIERALEFLQRWADLTGESNEPRLVRGPEATRQTHSSGRGQLFAAYLDAIAADTGDEPPSGAAWPTFDWMEGPRWWPFRGVLPNVIIGPTVENQHFADTRLNVLGQIHRLGWRTMVSYEPALQAVDFGPWLLRKGGRACSCGRNFFHLDACEVWQPVIDWLICGGESGSGRREFDHAWARSALRQCRAAGVPFFMKQDGAFRSEVFESLPADLKVREFPTMPGEEPAARRFEAPTPRVSQGTAP